MKRLALIAIGVAALASFNVTAQTPSCPLRRPRRRSPRTSRRSCTASARTATGPAKWRRCRCCRTRTRGRGRRRSRPRSWRARCRRGARTCRRRCRCATTSACRRKRSTPLPRGWMAAPRRGNAADMPPSPKFATGWTAGTEPDLVLEMPVEFEHPGRRRDRRADVLFEGAVDRRQVRGDRRAQAEQPRRAASRRHFLRRHSRRRLASSTAASSTRTAR